MRNDTGDSGQVAGSADRDPRLEAARLSARLDRLPFGRWHAKCVAVVGAAHFFDAFDALTIAFVLPVLMVEWGLTPGEASILVAIGYVGQTIGAIGLGRAAERYGRRRVLRWSLIILSIVSLLSAAAGGFLIFLILRVVQGFGLGGETPVGATYINEICPSRLRGRVVFALQAIFGLGVLATAFVAVWIIPHAGWRAMFLIGSLPFILAVLLPRLLPESPRWLAENGRADEALTIVSSIEQRLIAAGHSLPPPAADPVLPKIAERARIGDLVRDGYASRTLSSWVIALCISIAGYGIVVWMPTLYRTVFGLPLQQALVYSLATIVASFSGTLIGIALIDALGRRKSFILGFVGGAVPLLLLSYLGIGMGAKSVMLMSAGANVFLSFVLAGLYVYAPEIYPTRMRALGAGAMSAWLRMGSIIGPLMVGWLLPRAGSDGVFLLFGGAALVGGLAMLLFGIETKGRSLEDIAP
jgi:putative MFS transporter